MDADLWMLVRFALLLFCFVCSFYILSCMWRLLCALGRGVYALLLMADKLLCRWFDERPFESEARNWSIHVPENVSHVTDDTEHA